MKKEIIQIVLLILGNILLLWVTFTFLNPMFGYEIVDKVVIASLGGAIVTIYLIIKQFTKKK